jgi:uncharacterized protein
MYRRFAFLALLLMTLVACSSTPDWASAERSNRSTSHGSAGGTLPSAEAEVPTATPSPETQPPSQPAPSDQPSDDVPPTTAPDTVPTPTQEPTQEPTPTEAPEVTDGGFDTDATAADPAVFSTEAGPAGPDVATATQYIENVIQHADVIWTNWFLANGLQEPLVGYEIVQPGYEFTSNCGIVVNSTHPNAYYCPTDINVFNEAGVIILPVETMMKMWTGDMFGKRVTELDRVGDFAAAMLIAHEFGHHIADELAAQYNVPKTSLPEHLADCFAGVWAYSVYLDSYLEAGDIEEAIAAVGVIGDDDPSSPHGTPAERQNAFSLGFYGSQANPVGGVPGNCIAAFWPEVAN